MIRLSLYIFGKNTAKGMCPHCIIAVHKKSYIHIYTYTYVTIYDVGDFGTTF